MHDKFFFLFHLMVSHLCPLFVRYTHGKFYLLSIFDLSKEEIDLYILRTGIKKDKYKYYFPRI